MFDVKRLQETYVALVDAGTAITKGSVGFLGSLTAATINTWVGIAVGILTFVYIALQIESTLRKRRADIAREKKGEL